MCFAALSSFGGVGGVILKAALVGVLGGIVVEFFLEGEMRLLKKECIHISSSAFLFFSWPHPHFNVQFVVTAPKEAFL